MFYLHIELAEDFAVSEFAELMFSSFNEDML